MFSIPYTDARAQPEQKDHGDMVATRREDDMIEFGYELSGIVLLVVIISY